MLKTLYIKNYALIEELTVGFEHGLNIITGETGAGKSIIIDAMSLILGERADTDTVRKGAERAVVEGFFSLSGNTNLKSLLEANGVECGDELILRREVSIKGQSRCFINDSPATIALLRQAGDLLVDLHGQHEHQSLLRSETHIDLLDDFGGLEGLVKEFGDGYREAVSVLTAIRELRSKERQLKEKRELYEFQIKEIDAVGPQAGEEEQLESELRILENAERLHTETERLYQALYESDNAVHDQLVIMRNQLEDLSAIDKAFDEIKNEAASAAAIVSELAKFVQNYNSKIEFNPERLEAIRTRLGELAMLKKKYGGSVDAVIAHRTRIGEEAALAENFESELAGMDGKFREARKACSAIAERLSSKRRDVAKKINRSIEEALMTLGIANASFETRIENKVAAGSDHAVVKLGKDWFEATAKGIDIVQFFISTNAGEDVKQLVKVASGGEISRIMLALKTILAKTDRLPLLVFDEIDVGVSGRIAQTVGQSLKNLSRFHQVIAITHLPQIAGLADVHFVVEKTEEGKRSFTRMRKLELQERVVEVAKLLSGEEITRAGLQGARELMGLRPNSTTRS